MSSSRRGTNTSSSFSSSKKTPTALPRASSLQHIPPYPTYASPTLVYPPPFVYTPPPQPGHYYYAAPPVASPVVPPVSAPAAFSSSLKKSGSLSSPTSSVVVKKQKSSKCSHRTSYHQPYAPPIGYYYHPQQSHPISPQLPRQSSHYEERPAAVPPKASTPAAVVPAPEVAELPASEPISLAPVSTSNDEQLLDKNPPALVPIPTVAVTSTPTQHEFEFDADGVMAMNVEELLEVPDILPVKPSQPEEPATTTENQTAAEKATEMNWSEEMNRQQTALQELKMVTACSEELLLLQLLSEHQGDAQRAINSYFDMKRKQEEALEAARSRISPLSSSTSSTTADSMSNPPRASTPPLASSIQAPTLRVSTDSSSLRNTLEHSSLALGSKEEEDDTFETFDFMDEVDDFITCCDSSDDEMNGLDEEERQRRRAEKRKAQEENRKKDLANKLFRRMVDSSPTDFERYCKCLFEAQGYRVIHSGRRGDHGIDLNLNKGGMSYIVQCKRYTTNKVSEGALRDFYGAMTDARALRGFFVTTSTFTTYARKWCADKPSIVLIDHSALCKLLEEFGARMEKRIKASFGLSNSSTSSSLGGSSNSSSPSSSLTLSIPRSSSFDSSFAFLPSSSSRPSSRTSSPSSSMASLPCLPTSDSAPALARKEG